MKRRTRIQENRYNQAIGYAYGARDFSRDLKDLTLDISAWATYYSVLEEVNTVFQPSIQDAYSGFRELSLAEQKEKRAQWERRPWSMYEEMRGQNA